MPRHTLCLALIAFGLPATAQGLLDTHFSRTAKHAGGCFQRDYTLAHLSKHPDQRVTSILLAPVPLASPEGEIQLNVSITARGGAYFSGIAYCQTAAATLACGMEGDAGAFTLTGRPDSTVLLTVGDYGVNLEGSEGYFTLSADTGDDRAFLIPNVDSDFCN